MIFIVIFPPTANWRWTRVQQFSQMDANSKLTLLSLIWFRITTWKWQTDCAKSTNSDYIANDAQKVPAEGRIFHHKSFYSKCTLLNGLNFKGHKVCARASVFRIIFRQDGRHNGSIRCNSKRFDVQSMADATIKLLTLASVKKMPALKENQFGVWNSS